ncbi:hypothetical protein D3C72_1778950 [compost metagenome]
MNSNGSAARVKKPACQPNRAISLASSGGNTTAISPVPQRMAARARPRLRSNHRLTSCVQVMAMVPAQTSGMAKNARYNQPMECSIRVIAA